MNIDLTNKNALVGGASRGIGRAIAIELAMLGANVTLLSRSEDLLSSLSLKLDKSKGQKHGYQVVDYSKPQELFRSIKMLSQSKNFHILVNNTGGPAGGPMTEAEPDEFRDAFEKHIIAAQMMTKIVLPGMKKDNYGRIINIISTSVKEPIPNLGVSNTIRGAMGNWAKTLAGEVGKYGVTVNNILPGYTNTQRLGSIIKSKAERLNTSEKNVENSMKSNVPMGRFAEPQETANAAGFLASPAASYINGINLPVDGGRTNSL